MWPASWFRQAPVGSPARPRRSVVPRFEALEDRSLPSTFLVSDLSDSGTGSLRHAVASAANGDTIEFARGLQGTIVLTSGELSIGADVTIEGPGADRLSVSGDGAGRVFEITGGRVSISGLTIRDGLAAANNGGGVLVDPGATLTLDHVVLTDNTATADADGDSGSGGGVENDGALTASNSTFTSNLASGGDFTDPVTEGSAGGAIDSNGSALTVSNCTFTGNYAIGPATGTGEGNGGAINNSSAATVSDSTFTGNEVFGRTTNGGAISAGENENLSSSPAMTISNCAFTDNRAVGANGANDFTQKFGGQALGGAIANAAPLTIADSTFTDNLAGAGNGGNNLDGIDGGPFVDEALGGGLVNFGSPLTITDTTFSGNRAVAGSCVAGLGGSAAGGGVCLFGFQGPVTTLTGVTFIDNQALGGGGGAPGGTGFGGGLYNGVDSTVVVSGALFFGNLAAGGSGGAGAAGGVGAGGAVANGGGAGALEVTFLELGSDTSALSLVDSTLLADTAQGGAGGSGATGGNGLGGGLYALGTTGASIDATGIVADAAWGGARGPNGTAGQGVGGGLYVDAGADVTLDPASAVVFNFASTRADDIFGTVN